MPGAFADGDEAATAVDAVDVAEAAASAGFEIVIAAARAPGFFFA